MSLSDDWSMSCWAFFWLCFFFWSVFLFASSGMGQANLCWGPLWLWGFSSSFCIEYGLLGRHNMSFGVFSVFLGFDCFHFQLSALAQVCQFLVLFLFDSSWCIGFGFFVSFRWCPEFFCVFCSHFLLNTIGLWLHLSCLSSLFLTVFTSLNLRLLRVVFLSCKLVILFQQTLLFLGCFVFHVVRYVICHFAAVMPIKWGCVISLCYLVCCIHVWGVGDDILLDVSANSPSRRRGVVSLKV